MRQPKRKYDNIPRVKRVKRARFYIRNTKYRERCKANTEVKRCTYTWTHNMMGPSLMNQYTKIKTKLRTAHFIQYRSTELSQALISESRLTTFRVWSSELIASIYGVSRWGAPIRTGERIHTEPPAGYTDAIYIYLGTGFTFYVCVLQDAQQVPYVAYGRPRQHLISLFF